MQVNRSDAVARSFAPSLPRNLGISWSLLAVLAGLLLPALMGYVLADPDTYLHISAGNWMLQHGEVLTRDPFSFTRLGAAVSSQEWGSDLLIASVFRIAGWSGLLILASACFAATLGYLTRFLMARMEPLHALVLTAFAGLMMFPSVLARPHVLMWPLAAVWTGTLVHYSERKRAPPWWLLGVMLLWVNLHGSFMAGLVLACFLAVDSIIASGNERRQVARRWMVFTLAAFACCFVNPQGYHLVLFPFRLLAMKPALSLVAEWRPPNFEHPQVLGVWIVAFVALALTGRIRLSPVRAILVVGLLYMALEHGRSVALLGLISPFLLASPVAAQWRQIPGGGSDANALDRGFRAFASPAHAATVGLALPLAGLAVIWALQARQPRPPAYARPRAALDAVLARAPGGRILNDPNFGDYLIYRGIPDFMDDRLDLYGDTFMSETVKALSLAPGGDLEALLRRYRIDAMLLGVHRPVIQLLDHLPEWRRIYSDDVAVAYVRRSVPEP